jgi:hypothetical protein
VCCVALIRAAVVFELTSWGYCQQRTFTSLFLAVPAPYSPCYMHWQSGRSSNKFIVSVLKGLHSVRMLHPRDWAVRTRDKGRPCCLRAPLGCITES